MLRSPGEVGTRLRKDNGPVSIGRAHTNKNRNSKSGSLFAIENKKKTKTKKRKKRKGRKKREKREKEEKKEKRKKEKEKRRRRRKNRVGAANKRIRPGGDSLAFSGSLPPFGFGSLLEGSFDSASMRKFI